MNGATIRHTVAFRLKHLPESPEAAQFIADGVRILTAIPGVQKFEALHQTSKKNDFDFGFSMEFANQAAYDAYNDHPAHIAFVRDRWKPEVADFMEIDYVAYVAR